MALGLGSLCGVLVSVQTTLDLQDIRFSFIHCRLFMTLG
jgi:hypothetical protein